MASSLAVDLVAPAFGIHEPLHRWPVLIGLNFTVVGLAVLGRNAPASCDLNLFALIGNVRWLWPLVLPAEAVVAAAQLDDGHGNVLAVAVVVLTIAVFLVGLPLVGRLDRRHISLMLYGSALSLMLLTSMRSTYVLGFDISTEYADFHRAVVTGIWHTGHLNPYEAMLSLTVFPAALHSLVGGQDVWVLKFAYPVLFATFPVAVFLLTSRFLNRRVAFIASEIVIVQWYFFEQQPEIARQELAILIFAGIVGALLDTSLDRMRQFGFVSILGATLVLSHYSTAYVTILLCVMTGIFATVMTRIHREALAASPWFAAAAVISVAAAIWYVPITHSDNNLTYVAQSLKRSGLQLLPGARRGENVIEVYFNGLREPPPTASQYQLAIAHSYAIHYPFLVPLPVAHESRFDLRQAPGLSTPGAFPSMAHALNDAEFFVQQLMNGLGILGVAFLVFRRRSRPFPRTVGLVGLAALLILAASRLSGTLANDYNSSRLYL
ncbi:MAG: hypothetical protein WB770_11845, partial [Acidimicrobiales bacterium]